MVVRVDEPGSDDGAVQVLAGLGGRAATGGGHAPVVDLHPAGAVLGPGVVRTDDATLAKCDVLMIKIPTTRYSKDEVEAVKKKADTGPSSMMKTVEREEARKTQQAENAAN